MPRLGLAFECLPGERPRITGVTPGSAAQHADLQVGDRIFAVGRQPVLGATRHKLAHILEAQQGPQIVIQVRQCLWMHVCIMYATYVCMYACMRVCMHDAVCMSQVAQPRDDGGPVTVRTRVLTVDPREPGYGQASPRAERDFFETGADLVDSLWKRPPASKAWQAPRLRRQPTDAGIARTAPAPIHVPSGTAERQTGDFAALLATFDQLVLPPATQRGQDAWACHEDAQPSRPQVPVSVTAPQPARLSQQPCRQATRSSAPGVAERDSVKFARGLGLQFIDPGTPATKPPSFNLPGRGGDTDGLSADPVGSELNTADGEEKYVVFGTNAASAILEKSLEAFGGGRRGQSKALHGQNSLAEEGLSQSQTEVVGSETRPAFGTEAILPVIHQIFEPQRPPVEVKGGGAGLSEKARGAEPSSAPAAVDQTGVPDISGLKPAPFNGAVPTDSERAPACLPAAQRDMADYTRPAPPAAAIRMHLALPFEACGTQGSAQRFGFQAAIVSDLSKATGMPSSTFSIVAISAGSVVVDIQVCVETAMPGGRDPLAVVFDLQRQASIPGSPLSQGQVTCHCTRVQTFEVQSPAVSQPAPAGLRGKKGAKFVLAMHEVDIEEAEVCEIFLCVSLLSNDRKHTDLLHKTPGCVEGIEPQFTSHKKQVVARMASIKEKLAFTHLLRQSSWHELDLLLGRPVNILITVHDSRRPEHVLGKVYLPVEWGASVKTRQVALSGSDGRAPSQPNGRPAIMLLSYSYTDGGESGPSANAKVSRTSKGSGGVHSAAAADAPLGPEPANAVQPPLDLNLKPAPFNLPWDGRSPEGSDGTDWWDDLWAAAGQVKEHTTQRGRGPTQKAQRCQDETLLKRDRRPPQGAYRMTAKEPAVKALRALSMTGWDVLAVGVGDESYALHVQDALWHQGLVDSAVSPLRREHVFFVNKSSQVAEVARLLGGVMGVIDHDYATILSLQDHVEPGCRCVVLQPNATARQILRESLAPREEAEARMLDRVQELAQDLASLRSMEAGLQQQGVDILQSSADRALLPASSDPNVSHLLTACSRQQARVAELTRQLEVAAKKTAVQIVCCPRTRQEMMLSPRRSADAYMQACDVFDVDVAATHGHNGTQKSWAHASGVQSVPFYPLSHTQHPQKSSWDDLCAQGQTPPIGTVGIGVSASSVEGNFFVVQSIEYGSPAFCSQMLNKGDLLLSVDGIALKGLLLPEVNKLLEGAPGSSLTLGAAPRGMPNQIFYVYLLRKATPAAFRFKRGRILVLIDEVLLAEELIEHTKASVLRVRLVATRNLPLGVQHGDKEDVFGVVKLDTLSPLLEPQIHRSEAARVQEGQAVFVNGQVDFKVQDPIQQRVEVQMFRAASGPAGTVSTVVGRAEISVQDMVAASRDKQQDRQWFQLLGDNGMPVVGTAGLGAQVQLAGDIVLQTEATELQDKTGTVRGAGGRIQMLTGQMGESVGVTLIIDSDFNSVVGNTVAGKQRFGKELCLDLAAALRTSEDRFVVHELSAGSVRACVNIIPDPAGIDSRSAKALAMMLKDQSLDSSSMLRFASTTQGLRHVTLGQPFHGPSRDEADSWHDIPDNIPHS